MGLSPLSLFEKRYLLLGNKAMNTLNKNEARLIVDALNVVEDMLSVEYAHCSDTFDEVYMTKLENNEFDYINNTSDETILKIARDLVKQREKAKTIGYVNRYEDALPNPSFLNSFEKYYVLSKLNAVFDWTTEEKKEYRIVFDYIQKQFSSNFNLEYDISSAKARGEFERFDILMTKDYIRSLIKVELLNINGEKEKSMITLPEEEELIEIGKNDVITGNPDLYKKKFIITQAGVSLPFYINKNWDYEVLDAVEELHQFIIRITVDDQVKTTVLGNYPVNKVALIVRALIDFIYSPGEFVYIMPGA